MVHLVELESVYVNEESKKKEERTVLLNGVILSDKEIEHEETKNIVMHDLYLGAQSLKLAKKFERERAEYFDSLYDFSYGVVNLSDEPVYYGSTESKALNIIDQKNAYDLRTIKLKERYSRFRGVLRGLNEQDEYLLRRYFEHGHKVDYKALRACVNRLSKYLTKQEEARGKALDVEVNEEYAERLKVRRAKEGKAAAKKNEGKRQYMIDGRFVYMTDKEYQAHQQEQAERSQALEVQSRGLWKS